MTDRTLAAMKAALPIISAGCTEAIRQGNAPFAVNAQTVERQLIAAIEAYEKQEPAGYIVQEENQDHRGAGGVGVSSTYRIISRVD